MENWEYLPNGKPKHIKGMLNVLRQLVDEQGEEALEELYQKNVSKRRWWLSVHICAHVAFMVAMCFIAVCTLVIPERVKTHCNSWMETTDDFRGFREWKCNPGICFAVSKSNVWDTNANYMCPLGYHWATTEEYLRLAVSSNFQGETPYYDQGGWDGYVWQERKRRAFIFRDTINTGKWKDAATYVSRFLSNQPIRTHFNQRGVEFAGIVCVSNDTEGVQGILRATWTLITDISHFVVLSVTSAVETVFSSIESVTYVLF
jgi:hypothetical protein